MTVKMPKTESMARENLSLFSNNFAVCYCDDMPRGITGLLANNLVNTFGLPSCIISFSDADDGDATGSLRSARGYDLTAVLDQCADLFLDKGGHSFAAGFSMERKNFDAFLASMKDICANIEFTKADDSDKVDIDAELPPSYLTPQIMSLVDKFEPYGIDNEELVFLSRQLTITDISFIGKLEAKHVKLTLHTGRNYWDARYWNAAEKVNVDFSLNDKVDAVFRIKWDTFTGIAKPQLAILDIQRSKVAAYDGAK